MCNWLLLTGKLKNTMGEEYPSPDGKYMLGLSCSEMRMSHWVCTPYLLALETGQKLYQAAFDVDASDIQWSEDSRSVRFFMRVYPGSAPGKYVRLVINDEKAFLQDAP
jgi:hypothetical protein